MYVHKGCLAVAAGTMLVVAGMVSSASARPGNQEQINQAAALAEAKAAQSTAESRSMYRADAATKQDIRLVEKTAPVEAAEQPAEPAPTMAATTVDVQEAMPVFSIKQDLKNTPNWLWEDTKRVYTNPVNLAILLTAGGVSIAVHQHVDWTINNKFKDSRTCKEGWGDAANVIGHPVLHLGVAGAWYMARYEFKDLKTYNVGKNLLSALIITDLSTLTLKGACAGTEGPTGQHGSFPSGHTSSTFAMAAVMDQAYGHAVGVPMYALAGWVGFERIDDRKHMFSDVLFGGVLGLVIGHSVASGHLPQIAGGHIIPYTDPEQGSAGILWWKDTK